MKSRADQRARGGAPLAVGRDGRDHRDRGPPRGLATARSRRRDAPARAARRGRTRDPPTCRRAARRRRRAPPARPARLEPGDDAGPDRRLPGRGKAGEPDDGRHALQAYDAAAAAAATVPGVAFRPDPPAPFIVGVPRSGTTLLRLLLDAHPLLAIPPETGVRTRRRRRAGGPCRARERACARLEPWPDLEVGDAELDAIFAAVDPWSTGGGLRALFRSYARRHGKPRWGDKTPLHIEHMPRLARAAARGAVHPPQPRRPRRGRLAARGPVRARRRQHRGDRRRLARPDRVRAQRARHAAPLPRGPLRGPRRRPGRASSRSCAPGSTWRSTP